MRDRLDLVASQSADRLAAKLGTLGEAAAALAANDLIINSLVDIDDRDGYLKTLFRSLRIPGPAGAHITLTDYRGRTIRATGNAMEFGDVPWLQRVMRGETLFELSAEGLLIATPVLHDGAPEGTIVVNYPNDRMADVMAVGGGSGATLVVNRAGTVLYSSRPDLAVSGGVVSAVDLSFWLLAESWVPGFSGLTVVSAISADQAMAAVRGVEQVMLATVIFSLLALIGGIAVAAYLATKPLSGFNRSIGEIARARDLRFRVEPTGPAEFQDLANAFNAMIERLETTTTSRDRVDNILNSMTEMLIVTDHGGAVQSVNRAAQRIFGPDGQAIEGTQISDLFVAKGNELGVSPLAPESVAASPQAIEATCLPPNKREIPVLVSASALGAAGEGDDGLVYVVLDITERKKAEKLKSEFISVVSHELRTPLTSISGSLGLLKGGVAGDLPDQAKSMIDIAHNNCDRLVRLINDILDIEKIEAGKIRFEFRPLDIAQLVRDAVAANAGFAEGLGVEIALPADLPDARIEGDYDRLIQVLTNLISNAAKFAPPESAVTVSAVVEDGNVRISMIDRGPGISEEFQDRIFGKFAQADASDSRQKGGTGLGLNISKAIVERHDGEIGFVTEIGAGTEFYFDLPVLRELAEDAPAMGESSEPETWPNGIRILHVEDDPDLQRVVAALFDGVGAMTCACLRREAEQLLRRRKFDLIILDMLLPDGTGEDLLATLRGTDNRTTPVIVFAANEVPDQVARSVKAALVKSRTSNEHLLSVALAAIEEAASLSRQLEESCAEISRKATA